MKDICRQIKEKQKLRNNLLDLGLICTLVGPTGPPKFDSCIPKKISQVA